jgi:hypothetical protein
VLRPVQLAANAVLYTGLSVPQYLGPFFDDFETTQYILAADLFNLETYRLVTINKTVFEIYSRQELKPLYRTGEQRRTKAIAEKTACQNRKSFRDER